MFQYLPKTCLLWYSLSLERAALMDCTIFSLLTNEEDCFFLDIKEKDAETVCFVFQGVSILNWIQSIPDITNVLWPALFFRLCWNNHTYTFIHFSFYLVVVTPLHCILISLYLLTKLLVFWTLFYDLFILLILCLFKNQ